MKQEQQANLQKNVSLFIIKTEINELYLKKY